MLNLKQKDVKKKTDKENEVSAPAINIIKKKKKTTKKHNEKIKNATQKNKHLKKSKPQKKHIRGGDDRENAARVIAGRKQKQC